MPVLDSRVSRSRDEPGLTSAASVAEARAMLSAWVPATATMPSTAQMMAEIDAHVLEKHGLRRMPPDDDTTPSA